MEVWKDIKGYEGFYQVSNLGRVKSLKRVVNSKNQYGDYSITKKEQILSHGINNHGYCGVILQNRSKKAVAVHRLVAKAFIPNPENKVQVNHINGDKADNRVSNLEWATNSENQLHSYDTGLNKPSSGNTKLTASEVKEIRSCYSAGLMNQVELARKYNVNKTAINKIVHNKTWTTI